jgi:hypothetical protein
VQRYRKKSDPACSLFYRSVFSIKKVGIFTEAIPLSYTVAGQRCAARLCDKVFAKTQ